MLMNTMIKKQLAARQGLLSTSLRSFGIIQDYN
jgi:ubiquinol-cytochrome c reductase iron-sulfur subunit